MSEINARIATRDVPEAIRARKNFVCGELSGCVTLGKGRMTYLRGLPPILADAYRSDAHYPGIAYEVWSHGAPLGWILANGDGVMALSGLSQHLTDPQRRHWHIIAAAFTGTD